MEKWNLIIYCPAYNVENSIGEFLERMKKVKEELNQKNIGISKLIIVDDGSTDKTKQILGEFEKNNRFMKLISRKENVGPVRTIFEGMAAANGEAGELPKDRTILVRMDTDMEHDPLEIQKMVEPIVNGTSRITVGLIDFRDYPIEAKLLNDIIGSAESRKYLNINIPQFCPGFNAIRADLFASIYPALADKSKEFAAKYDKEMLTMDFIILVLAKKIDKNLEVIRLCAVDKKWIRKQPLRKILQYLDYHHKTCDFLD